MKFQFKTQPFQTAAVESVVNIFAGQNKQDVVHYRRDVGTTKQEIDLFTDEDFDFEAAYRNAPLDLDGTALLKNIRAVQTMNNVKLSPSILGDEVPVDKKTKKPLKQPDNRLGAVSLDVEMETGTGKTYVYIKTMFELHKTYGWGKFIVVVPSIAIREGVKKTFEITEEHFMDKYGIKARFFVYNSSDLHQLDEFSQSNGINVMIINTQAFAKSFGDDDGKKQSKEKLIIYSKRDEFGSRRPIDVIKANNPIIILDEPQKMGGAATQNALKKEFNPLFSLNYSATHKISHSLVYVLDALDAFTNELVKKIEVKGFELKNLAGMDGYLYISEIVVGKGAPRARIEYEVKQGGGVKRMRKLFDETDSIYTASGSLEQYKNLSVAEIDARSGTVTFSNGVTLRSGEATGNVNERDIRRIQIRETIISHFEKEEKLFEQGIKCLSLFFIDEVAKYRQYNEDGEEILGEYGRIFEEEYLDIMNENMTIFPTAYQDYLREIEIARTHKGYFSIDKKTKHIVDSDVKRGAEFSDDISAYDLILKNKERLLSFDEPTRFIFSHSALREGWDNPNVFQICTLKHSDNATAKRQEVGRGLRLCVDRSGVRQDIDVCGERQVHGVNKLTVIASDSYATFVDDLQREIKSDLYERPTLASIEYFTKKVIHTATGQQHTLDEKQAKAIYNYLIKHDYVDDDGKVTDEYRNANASGTLAPLKEELAPFAEEIHKLVQGIFDPTILNGMVDNGHETKIPENKINANWEKFKDLWERINTRYAYTVEFKREDVIAKSIITIDKELWVSELSYTSTIGSQDIENESTDLTAGKTQTKKLKRPQSSRVLYDIIGKISEGTTLTRRSVAEILNGITPVKRRMLQQNPEEFISKVILLINNQKADVVVDKITYAPTAEEPYTQDIFNISRSNEAYNQAFESTKAIQPYIFTDGGTDSIERNFAQNLEIADEVIVYAKLPAGRKGFCIPTPVGNYSPDWAISFKVGSVKHIFFIAETKGTTDSTQFRKIEDTKIACAKKLFNELSTSTVKYHEVDSYDTLLSVMEKL